MPSISSIQDALKILTMRNSHHEKVMLALMVSLGLFGLGLLAHAFFLVEGTLRVAEIVGSCLFETLILLPYNKIQDLRKHNIMIGMLAAIIDRFQDKVDSATLQNLIEELLKYILKR